ncbi:response regulator [Methylocystis echinoides]|uniref:DNA-binding response regulator n=1 Tax=Methylocystis echinoides TaxID=29468 RepID=A0A9W6LTY6_9HYPH|nr:response regulator transcription factor [Methylocystis echinoides]GLI94899.1 DNA-binding response regulator [Methylocystis echinoides]
MSLRPLILVVDDEPQIQRFLRPALTAAGYDVEQASTGAEAMRLAERRAPSLVILDLGLPDADGKTIITALRRQMETPIIVLSAREREAEKVAALDLGADDYVAKPFGIGELLARIRVCLRAGKADLTQSESLQVGALTIDLPSRKVTLGNAPVKLTPKEFDLLTLLAMHPGRVMTHRQILQKIWGPAHVEDTPYLRVFIGQLRAKIEGDPASPRMIVTEPGVGYRLSGD